MRFAFFFFIFYFFSLTITAQSVKVYYSFNEAINDSNKVKKLSLSGDSLNSFSSDVLKLKNLEEIAFESNESFGFDGVMPLLTQLKTIKKLWISDIKVSNLDGVSGMKNLEELDLVSLDLIVLPDEISKLEKLKEIGLDGNQKLNLDQAFNVLSKVKSLKVLTLQDNKLTDLPAGLSQLNSLESLWLDNNDFLEIPLSVKKSNIKYLRLFNNKLERLNLKKGDLRNLNQIDLCYNNFRIFPATELGLLPRLDTVIMWYANIECVSKDIGKLKKLRRLNLQHNSIGKLPSQIKLLKELRAIELSENNLTTDGVKDIYRLKKLEKLDLYRNNINKILPEIGNLTTLKNLSLCEIPLTEIPQTIARLKKLEIIQLGYYESFDWQDAIKTIGTLPKLKYVGLFKMGLKTMPSGFEKLTSVESFWMNWNLFDKNEQVRLQAMHPSAKFSFK